MRHFGGAVALVVGVAEITIPMFTLCVSEPLDPMIESVKEPMEAVEDALAVSVVVAGVLGVGVTGPGRLIETPEGAESQE
jgi:hypothetical protein